VQDLFIYRGAVFRNRLIICLVGVAAGLPLAIAGSRLLQSMLFGVTPGDPLMFLRALAGLIIVALLPVLCRRFEPHPSNRLPPRDKNEFGNISSTVANILNRFPSAREESQG